MLPRREKKRKQRGDLSGVESRSEVAESKDAEDGRLSIELLSLIS